MKKIIIIAIVVLLIVVGVNLYAPPAQKQSHDNIRVGVLSFLTGLYAEMGQDAVNGAIIATEESNAANDFQLELIIEDGRASAPDSLKAFRKLLLDKIDVAIVMGDNQVPPVAPLIVEHKIPTILTICSNSSWLKYNQDVYMLNSGPSAYSFSFKVGEYARTDLKLNNVAIMSMISSFGQEAVDAFSDGFKGKIVSHEKFNPDETNVRISVLKIIQANPDAVFVAGYGKGYIIALNQLRELGYKGVILSVDAVTNPDTKENARDLTWIIFGKHRDLDLIDDSAYIDFENRYKNRFKKDPSLFSKLGYDSVRILVEVIREGGREHIHEGLKSIKEIDTFSGVIKFNPDGSSVFPLAIMQIQPDGTAKVMK